MRNPGCLAATVFFLCLASAYAEENRGALFSGISSTTISGYVSGAGNPGNQSSPEDAVISVRAMRRLIFEDRFSGHPLGTVPATFVFRRAGRTNETLTVPFELSGTAQPDIDYVRILDAPGIIGTGAVQTVVFAPGERLQYASFHITLDDTPERAEFIRLKIIPPIPNGAIPIVAPEYRVGKRGCATVWISNQDRCVRSVSTPGGGVQCLEFRPTFLPRAFFTTAHCR